ncbi:MAG: MBL fold metallo-hydrolase [Zymomonas mobilis subsp. pomaceae]|uniref:Beta-lactamase domain protein n=1 Tax=Zymomonas mobilis subsp. pomaceae (strain ATCC 29192 / DSM 22645 / JCM 10191 / CCUG 17912 / NBRC 13757 / NCIMB 11200 / NRRL B-4491 / Barker I) TaxID=579138 RepID=F8EU18_ZYMMT|nr:MBL fold metallo-hydrolase [Zymomonas mobilis]AEI37098.1 beta-lactamase domain protein [Zymomonas mobilis subsp. pomaceae ATCC 29192]MDX5948469.1 MBL fold metallo-hydrolase [Zymomonas mobilis subsp. pomaceae]GEB89466.1 phosphoribosyl 1,2-cyclic phosphodiesterase [Zymomonas mobilis subsp. pomaceae]
MKLRLLGSGTSSGVPRIGNNWGECDPKESKNRRSRASLYVETPNMNLLVDTSPDMREQLLKADISTLDAVLWTHDHADHCHGIDDLRQIFHAKGHPIPGFARPETLDGLRRRFAYVFEGFGEYRPTVKGHYLPDHLTIGDIHIKVVDQPHARATSAGFCFEHNGFRVGYATDFNHITEEMAELYQGVDLWVVDTLREKPHPSHPHLAMIVSWVKKLKVKRAVTCHMDHSMDYATLSRILPDNMEVGYDGWTWDSALE